jgi:4-amino-4-deoxy-L-arabinose transferase-like glycosyltransferase
MEFLSFFTIDGFINPYLLLAIIPTIIILFFFLRHDFVQLKEDTKRKDRRRKLQWIVFVFRAIMLSLVIVALAGPYHSTENIFKGDPVVHIVVDDSKSMELFAPIHQSLISALEKKVDVDITMMTEKDTTNIGDSVLSALRPYESVLLVSDGNTNRGGELGDISLYASSINATINTIQLDKRHDESSVAIIGPEKVLLSLMK